jgi:N-methylhydantoinase A
MLATAGFSDVPDMGLEQRYDLFDLRLKFPAPLVPRRLRREVRERVMFDGAVEQPLDEAGARAAIEDLVRKHDVKALAVCLLHSYANPAHESRIAELAAEAYPGLYVSTSADVFPNMREYERWTTTMVNAYTQPMFDRYLGRLEQGLADRGFRGRIAIMTSSGGVVTTETARRFPVRMLESGPAAGVLMSAVHGRRLGLPNLLSFDMGGTTAKGALIRNHLPLKKYDMEVARVHEFKRGSGLPVKIPVIDMIEIGAGGGSIAEVDERGLIRVGPRSAGADPGPACYGRGGERATLTDANLVLGYLDPAFFLGGAMRLDVKAAETAIARSVAEPLKLDSARAAFGIHEIVNEDVARAFRIHASERGFDYRSCSMTAFGGGGPIHGMAIARKLKIPRVVYPVGAGVMSAFGLLASPPAFEVSRSRRVFVEDLDEAGFAAAFAPLVEEASGFLKRAGLKEEQIGLVRKLDMRYHGQGYDIEVTLPEGAGLARAPELFVARYKEIYALALLDEPVEIVAWKVEAVGPDPGLAGGYSLTQGGGEAKAALKGSRRAYEPLAAAYVDTPVYDRYRLGPGVSIEGPALIEERESTCVIGKGDRVTVDAQYNLVAELTA